jgi:hypothetical protein
MENIRQTFDSNINNILDNFVRKPTIIKGIVHLLLVLYVVRLAPQPPLVILQLFQNIYFKLFIFTLVLWTAQFSPSTSLLIALAFLVTMNYVNTGKVWEYLENVNADVVVPAQPVAVAPAQPVAVAPAQAVEAVKVLADAAASPAAASKDVVVPVANIAVSAVKTEEGVAAVQALAQQAIVPEAGVPEKVNAAAQTAVDSIVAKPVMDATVVKPAVEVINQGIDAVKALAQAAASPEAQEPQDVIPVAEIAVKVAQVSAPTPADAEVAVSAIKALSEQAMKPEAGKEEQVAAAAQAAVNVIAAPVVQAAQPQASGCYPVRNYDMSLVKPQIDGRFTYEDYMTYTPSPQ